MAEPWSLNSASPAASRRPDRRARQRAILRRARHADVPRPGVSAAGIPPRRRSRRDPRATGCGGSGSAATRRSSGGPCRLDDGEAYTVVGVMPPGLELRLFDNRFTRPEPLVWLPKQGFEDFEPKHSRQRRVLERASADCGQACRLTRRGPSSTRCRRSLRGEYPQSNAKHRRAGRAAARPSGRQPARRLAAAARRSSDPADRGLRQRREPAARARRRTRPGVCRAPGARRQPRPAGPPDARREPPARDSWRRRGAGARALDAGRDRATPPDGRRARGSAFPSTAAPLSSPAA